VTATLGLLMDDADEAEYTQVEKIWAWNAAQRHFAVHTSRQRVTEGVTIESSGRAIVLPDDFFAMGRLYDPVDEKYWSMSTVFEPGAYEVRDGNDPLWTHWGNRLILGDEISASNSMEMWYYAYWPEIEYQTVASVVTIVQENITVPRWAETALLYLAGAFLLYPKSIQAAMVRQWNMMIDSGNPMMNPRLQEAWDKYKWYTELISHYAPLETGGMV